MRDQTYIELDDIIGVRITCACGIISEGSISNFAKRSVCTNLNCSQHWQTGQEDDKQKQNDITQLANFLEQWTAFARALTQSKESRRFSIEFALKPRKERVGGTPHPDEN